MVLVVGKSPSDLEIVYEREVLRQVLVRALLAVSNVATNMFNCAASRDWPTIVSLSLRYKYGGSFAPSPSVTSSSSGFDGWHGAHCLRQLLRRKNDLDVAAINSTCR